MISLHRIWKIYLLLTIDTLYSEIKTENTNDTIFTDIDQWTGKRALKISSV